MPEYPIWYLRSNLVFLEKRSPPLYYKNKAVQKYHKIKAIQPEGSSRSNEIDMFDSDGEHPDEQLRTGSVTFLDESCTPSRLSPPSAPLEANRCSFCACRLGFPFFHILPLSNSFDCLYCKKMSSIATPGPHLGLTNYHFLKKNTHNLSNIVLISLW